MKLILVLGALVAFLPRPAFAGKEFEIFDGQYYNGQFYPLVESIEWGEQDHELPHMEFHIHQKDKPVGLSVVSGKKNGHPVLWVMYDLAYRGEHVCRRVLAPAQFQEGQKVFVYRDDADPDYDNIYVYSQPWAQKRAKKVAEYAMPAYERCADENADNMPAPKDSKAPAAPSVPSASPPVKAETAAVQGPAPASVSVPAKKGLPTDYDNAAVPFSF